jgi:hypothetical protein
VNSPGDTIVVLGSTRIRAVEALSEEVIHTGRLGHLAGLVKVDLGDEGVEGNVKLVFLGTILILGVGHLEDKVAGSRADVLAVHGKGNLVDQVVGVARL